MIMQSIFSGILIGICVNVNLISDNKYVGAMLFSLGLLSIIKFDLKLYTGKIGYYKAEKPINLAIILLFNLLGVFIPVFSVVSFKSTIYDILLFVAKNKFSHSVEELLLCSLLCGILMFIAVHSKDPLIIVFSIMTFILSGYEHCIASFPYLLVEFSIYNLFKFVMIIIGNTFGSIIANGFIIYQNDGR